MVSEGCRSDVASYGVGSRISGGEARKRCVSIDCRWFEDGAGTISFSTGFGGDAPRINCLARPAAVSSGVVGV